MSRRRLAVGAAWAVPVVLGASAAPAMAASSLCPNPPVWNFQVTATKPSAPANAGTDTYLLTSALTLGVFTATYTNLGGPIPAGEATIQVMFPWYIDNATLKGFLWQSATVTAVSGGYTLTAAGQDTWVVGLDNSSWKGDNYTVNQAIPTGGTFTVSWTLTAYADVVPTRLARRVGGGQTNYRTLSLGKISATDCANVYHESQVESPAFWLRTPA